MKEKAAGRDCIDAARRREDEFMARAGQQNDEALTKNLKLENSVIAPTVENSAST